MLTKIRANRPKDNKLKHCREWLVTTLLVKSDARTLSSAGLLAGEIVLLTIGGLWTAKTLLIPPQRSPSAGVLGAVKQIIKWFPLLAVLLLLSLAAAHMAQWGERRYRRGRMAAGAAFVPAVPLILSILLSQPLFAIAPWLVFVVIWGTAELWWHLFVHFLRRLAVFDYWAELERETKAAESDTAYDLNFYREHLESKKTALKERKLRRQAMAESECEDAAPAEASGQTLTPAADRKNRPITGIHSRLIIPLALSCLLGLSGIFFHQMEFKKAQVPPPEATDSPTAPSQVVFWYQAPEPEASLLEELIAAYNQQILDPTASPPVVGVNQPVDMLLRIFQAQVAGNGPDVMLLPQEFALELHRNRNPLAVESGRTSSYLPLWPDRPWRQRLALVVSPNTQLPKQALDFAAYLHQQLTKY